jgi:hypothetical protein
MIGGIVLVERNGKTHMRMAPQRKVKNSWSPRQILHRQRFKEVNAFCSLFKATLIHQIWNYEAQQMTGYSLFLKTNMAAFGPDGALEDALKIRLSTGKLPFPPDLKAQRSASDPTTVEVRWTRENLKGFRMSDELLLISAADGHYSQLTATGLVRDSLNASFALPRLPPAATHLYLLFASKDRRDYSVSECFEI